jgi:iron(III) transport system permease protein
MATLVARGAQARRVVNPWGLVTLALGIGILGLLILFPLSRVLALSFVREGAPVTPASLTFANFARFFTSGLYQKALINSLIAGGATVAGSLVLGIPLAYILARVQVPFRAALISLGTLPLILPPFVGAYSWILLLGRQGVLTTLLRDLLGIRLPGIIGPFGVIITMVLSYYPFVFLPMLGALAASDPSVEESALTLGATPLRRVLTVTLPLVLPTVGAGAIIVFMRAIGNFGVPALLGGEFYVLPTLVYFEVTGNFNLHGAGAIALVSTLFSLGSLLALRWATGRGGYVTITSQARAVVQIVHPISRWVGFAFCALVIGISLLPHATVLLASFAERWVATPLPTVLSLANYRRAFTLSMDAIRNSLVLSLATTLLCVLVGSVMAHAAARRRMRGRWIIDVTIMLPFVLPGIMVGVAILSAFNGSPFFLAGTGTILLIAYFIRRLPYTFRSGVAALTQTDVTLEEASLTCGANQTTTFRRITLPLIAPGVLAGATITFATLLGELTTTLLLYSARWKTIAVKIFEFISYDQTGPASALGALLVVVVLVTVLIANRLAGRNLTSALGG